MASTRCPHCSSTVFETKIFEPPGGRYKQVFVQCGSCGTPYGVLDYFNLGSKLADLQEKVSEMDSKLDRLGAALNQIVHALQRSQ